MSAPSPHAAGPVRILVVDDEPNNLRLISDILGGQYQLSLASSGQQALQLVDVAGSQIDLVLLDLMMPGMDGHEVFRALRSRPALAELPVIFVTAHQDPSSEITALQSGVADYLHKPLHVGLTRARVEHQLTLARQRRELQAAREAADAGHRAKSRFLTGVSHELRTPLNVILGFSQGLQNCDGLTPELRAGLQDIEAAGRHLLALINDLLDLGKAEATGPVLNLEPVHLPEVVQDSLRLLEPLARPRQVALSWQQEEEAPVLAWADTMRVRQVLVNLLSNAIKFTRPGTPVQVRIRSVSAAPDTTDSEAAATGQIMVEVRDEGPGLEPELQAVVFEAFRRGSGPEVQQTEGTGIGLTISRHLIQWMGGRIGCESPAGQGARFWFTLPAHASAQAWPGRTQRAEPQTAPPAASRATPGPTASPIGGASVSTVLCVDDNAANLRLLELVLRRVPGIKVVATTNPHQALPLARKERPHAIVLDIQMPDLDGYGVLRQLRADPSLAAIPVIALSANAMQEDVEQGLAGGFADYLTKPFATERLLGVLRRALGP